ncbi:MAG: Uma2 family endonuclease [Saprospiraceae bacterium]|nr:Uma2 family endonuclease [Saprospiraceae bacterium]
MGYSPILRPIVKSPRLHQLIEELTDIWEKEQKRRLEFYDWVTPEIKAEFIDGEIIVHSPVRSLHNQVLLNINNLIFNFVNISNLGYVGYEKVMVRLHRNDFEPDLVFFKKEKSMYFDKELTIFPVPDFVVEILSVSTEERDKGIKLEDYEYNGVLEYWIVDADVNEIHQNILVGSKYVKKTLQAGESITSHAIDGFTCKVDAFFDQTENIKALSELVK